jgi:hypothetical protein
MVQQKSKKGFASIKGDYLKKISSRGGKIAHQMGRAHEFDSKEAKVAGRKGGKGNIGRKLTPEHKKKISEGMKKVNKKIKKQP